MATIIPEYLPSKATRGEEKLHAILQRLPSHWQAWWEPDLGVAHHPDFVVLAPEFGLLVLEDKYWRPGTILGGDRHELVIATRDSSRTKVKHPARQVRDYAFRLMDLVKEPTFGKRFIRPAGPYEGKLRFPIAHVVTLSNITDAQLNDPARDLAPLFDHDITVTRDRLDQWLSLSQEELVAEFQSFFAPFWTIPPFDEQEVKALRMIINPQAQLTDQFNTKELLASAKPIDDQQDILKVFDERQERCAMNVGEGHRILFGVAGSGKTLILLTRARLLAKQNPDAHILLTCYNRALASWMSECLRETPNVTVTTFHAWGLQNGVRFGDRTDEEYGNALLHQLDQGSPDATRFDAILVDEAQDFEPNWFTCLVRAMKDPENGDLLIVADAAQGLYRRSKLSWKALGINAAGRSHSRRFDLDRNYRNSSEILALAEAFATRAEMRLSTNEDDSLRAVRIDARSAFRGTGASPLLFVRSSWEAEANTAVGLVRRLLEGRWNDRSMAPMKAHEIAVLYPRASARQKELLQGLPEQIHQTCQVGAAWKNQQSGDPESRVQIDTIHASKGLQYRAVILLWTGIRPIVTETQTQEESEALDRRLLYVGMTRAESFLAITASGRSPYVEDIADSPACVVVEGTKQIGWEHEDRAQISIVHP